MFSFPFALRTLGCCPGQDSPFSDIWSPGRTGCASSAIGKSTFMIWSTLVMHPGLPTQDTSGPLQEHSGNQIVLKRSESGLSSSFRVVLNSHIATAYVCNTTVSTYSPHSCPISLTFPSAWEQIPFLSKVKQANGVGQVTQESHKLHSSQH